MGKAGWAALRLLPKLRVMVWSFSACADVDTMSCGECSSTCHSRTVGRFAGTGAWHEPASPSGHLQASVWHAVLWRGQWQGWI